MRFPFRLAISVLSLATVASSIASIDQDSTRMSIFQKIKAVIDPAFLRSRRRLGQDNQDNESNKNNNKDAEAKPSETSANARDISITFSILAVQSNTTTPRLQQVRPPMVECAVTRLLCQETDLNITATSNDPSSTSACRAIRSSKSSPQAIFGQRTENAMLSAQANAEKAIIMQRQHGLAYSEWTITYKAFFYNVQDETATLSVNRDAAELQALVQYTTDAYVQDGTMDKLLKYCYEEIQDNDNEAQKKMELEIYSSSVGDELDTFAAFAAEPTITEDSKPAWLEWFAEQDLALVIGLAVAAGILLLLTLWLTIFCCRRRSASPTMNKKRSKSDLIRPLPLQKATTVTTVKQSDHSSCDDDEVITFQEEDIFQSQAAARVLDLLEHGSESSMTEGNFDDDAVFSLCDHRDYGCGPAPPPVMYVPTGGALAMNKQEEFVSDEEEGEWFDGDEDNDDEISTLSVPNALEHGRVNAPAHVQRELLMTNVTRGNSVGLALYSTDMSHMPSSDDDTVTEASQGYASEGDAGLTLLAHEEDESSVATSPILRRSQSMDSERMPAHDNKVSMNLQGDSDFARLRPIDLAIFRGGDIHVKDLDSGRVLPLELAVNLKGIHVKNLDSGRVLPLESAASF
ncbi:hypothetical protein MPSEU_000738400 [Mayamaea pseudoterrestris]|nr:hypothetical protein MPSEU_000738400 [Mayamaea pseudoterrestris]